MSVPACARCRPSVAPRHLSRLLSTSVKAPIKASQRRSQSTDAAAATPSASAQPNHAVIFSGIQPTGIPHLGNYLGAMRQWKHLQDAAGPDDKLFFSIVDLHAITMPQDAPILRQHSKQMLAALLAIGLDPDKSVLFYQSSVPAHVELMWILSCTASMGYLNRMTQWKSKITQDDKGMPLDEETVGAKLKLGLFSYPVLQAADILIHRATHVPVGDDQKQHLEFARECATNFNAAYAGGNLVAPQTITTQSPRVMSLMNPSNKMSKSAPNHRSRILLTATDDEIRSRIRGAVTDRLGNHVTYDPASRPGVANLVELWARCDPQGRQPGELVDSLGGSGTLKDLKDNVAEAIIRELRGVRERCNEVLYRDGGRWLDEVQARGAEKARASAEETMRMVRDVVGLVRLP